MVTRQHLLGGFAAAAIAVAVQVLWKCLFHCLFIATAAFACQQLWSSRRRRLRAARVAGHTKIDLLPIERSPAICRSGPISTATFYRGSPAAAESYLAQRTAEIVAANPWLASTLDCDPETGEMALYYANADRRCLFKRRGVSLPVDRDGRVTSCEELVRALAPDLCKSSVDAVGTDCPLFFVTLLIDVGAQDADERFALVVSANHTLLDGHGYYKFYNMLSTDAAVEGLSPVRKTALPPRFLEALGGETVPITECPPGFIVRMLTAQLRSKLFPQTQVLAFDISADWIARQKADHLAVSRSSGSEVPFVSTNDCVVSKFFQCLRPDFAMMAINWRGRIAGCHEDDVGNYEALLTYMPADYASPALVRRSVSGAPYRGAARPPTVMPGNWKHATSATYGATTNWTTFARSLLLPADAVQELHLPLYEWKKDCPACVFGAINLFRPAAGRIAAMVLGKQDVIDSVRASGMVGKLLTVMDDGNGEEKNSSHDALHHLTSPSHSKV